MGTGERRGVESQRVMERREHTERKSVGKLSCDGFKWERPHPTVPLGAELLGEDAWVLERVGPVCPCPGIPNLYSCL